MYRSAELFLACAGIAALAGCASATTESATRPCCRTLPAGNTLSTKPAYDALSVWETDDGKAVALKTLEGCPQVVAMFYASCHVACPITLQRMKHLEAAMTAADRLRVGFVMVTLDPVNDSAAVLRSYRLTERLTPRWTLLRGIPAATEQFARSLGVAFSRDSLRLAHSSQLALLDQNGMVVFRQLDMNENPKRMLDAIRSLMGRP